MGNPLWIATRKGLFPVTRAASGWSVGAPSFLGEPVTMVLDDARDGSVYAALNLGHFGAKMQRSTDRGRTWDERSVPSFEFAAPANGASASPPAGETPAAKPPALHQVWALEAGGNGSLWAGTIPGALFRSQDQAQSWEPVRSLWDRAERKEWFGGGYDQPGVHSIAVDPRDARRVTIGVSCGGVWHTADEGVSWENRSRGMFAAYMPPEQRENPNIQDPHRVVQCPASPDVLWSQHHNGVFHTRDAGRQWTEVAAARPSVFGFGVAVHPTDPETAWFAPAVKDERRVPVDGALVVSRTRDGGRTFEVLSDGLPKPSYDLIYRHALDVDTDGNTLALGSTTGGLWISENGGDTWRTISTHLPPIYGVRFGSEG